MIPFKMINLDKPRRLRFGMEAILEFQQLTGVKLMAMDHSPETYVKALWVMLRQDDPDLTLKDTCRLVDDYCERITDAIIVVDEVLDNVFPKVEPDPNVQTPTAK